MWEWYRIEIHKKIEVELFDDTILPSLLMSLESKNVIILYAKHTVNFSFVYKQRTLIMHVSCLISRVNFNTERITVWFTDLFCRRELCFRWSLRDNRTEFCRILKLSYWLSAAASWRKRLDARLPLVGSRVLVSVTPSGFRGGRNGVWVGFSQGFSRFPLPQISFHHFSTPISFISFHPPLWWCVRRGRPAPLLITDLNYRGFITSHPSTRPRVGHELRIYGKYRNFMILIVQNLDFENRIQNFDSIGPLYCELLFFKLILIYKFQNVSCTLAFEVKHSKFFCICFRTYIMILSMDFMINKLFWP